jgi:hypothetical protein
MSDILTFLRNEGIYMKIYGSIRNSKTGSPIKGAKVELGIDHRENYVILSDDSGRFEYQIAGKHGIVDINVEKDGYVPKSLSYQIDKPELQVSVVLDEESIPPDEDSIQPDIYILPSQPVPKAKKWYMPIKEFIENNSTILGRFLNDKIMEYRKKRGENKEVEDLRKKLETYENKSILLDNDLDDYEDLIDKLESKLGIESVSENAFVNWNLEKIKPKKSAFNIDIRVIEGDYQDARDVMSRPKSEKNHHIGDKVNLYFKSEKDCYLTLLNYGTSGKLTVLFPNSLFKENFIKANTIYAIPGRDYPFDYIISGPAGIERIKAIAVIEKVDLIKLVYRKGEIFSTSTSASRDISVAAKKIQTMEVQRWAEAMCEIVVV